MEYLTITTRPAEVTELCVVRRIVFQIERCSKFSVEKYGTPQCDNTKQTVQLLNRAVMTSLSDCSSVSQEDDNIPLWAYLLHCSKNLLSKQSAEVSTFMLCYSHY